MIFIENPCSGYAIANLDFTKISDGFDYIFIHRKMSSLNKGTKRKLWAKRNPSIHWTNPLCNNTRKEILPIRRPSCSCYAFHHKNFIRAAEQEWQLSTYDWINFSNVTLFSIVSLLILSVSGKIKSFPPQANTMSFLETRFPSTTVIMTKAWRMIIESTDMNSRITHRNVSTTKGLFTPPTNVPLGGMQNKTSQVENWMTPLSQCLLLHFQYIILFSDVFFFFWLWGLRVPRILSVSQGGTR